MKRSELKVGDKVAYVRTSYGSTEIQEAVILSTDPYTKTYTHRYYSPTTVTLDGVDYVGSGFDKASAFRNDGANGVLIGIVTRYGHEAKLTQLRQLQPLAEALSEKAERERNKAEWAERTKTLEAQRKARALRVLADPAIRLGVEHIWTRSGESITVSLDWLEDIAQRLGSTEEYDKPAPLEGARP